MGELKNAPGKSYRKGISLIKALQEFGDDTKAEAWLVAQRWQEGIRCPFCESDGISPRKTSRKTPQYRCRACRKDFTVKTGTIMEDSKLPLSKWAIAFYLCTTNLKGVSSMKLHRDLEITQKTAWFLEHRIRETWVDKTERMAGPVEADETYIGAKAAGMHKSKKRKSGRGTVGKTAVMGVKDRATNQVIAHSVQSTDRMTVQSFVLDHTDTEAMVYSDDAAQYRGIPRKHESIAHSVGEYVRRQASTNGIESFWAMLKRGQDGTYHHFSVKHLDRYVTEFTGRHNARPLDTEEQLAKMALGAVGKRLSYAQLVGPKDTRLQGL